MSVDVTLRMRARDAAHMARALSFAVLELEGIDRHKRSVRRWRSLARRLEALVQEAHDSARELRANPNGSDVNHPAIPDRSERT